MKIMRITLLLLLTPAIMLAAGGSLLAAANLYRQWFFSSWQWIYFAAGCATALSALILLYAMRNILPGVVRQFLFLHHLQHEIVHLTFGLATLSGVHKLNVSTSGGVVEVGNSPFGFITALSPYLVSIPLTAVLAYILLISPSASAYAYLALGAAFSYHLLTVISSTYPAQTDFSHTKYPVGLIWVVSFLIIITCVVFAVVANSKNGLNIFVNSTISGLETIINGAISVGTKWRSYGL